MCKNILALKRNHYVRVGTVIPRNEVCNSCHVQSMTHLLSNVVRCGSPILMQSRVGFGSLTNTWTQRTTDTPHSGHAETTRDKLQSHVVPSKNLSLTFNDFIVMLPTTWKEAMSIAFVRQFVRPSVCPSVAHVANNSSTQRPSVPKF